MYIKVLNLKQLDMFLNSMTIKEELCLHHINVILIEMEQIISSYIILTNAQCKFIDLQNFQWPVVITNLTF